MTGTENKTELVTAEELAVIFGVTSFTIREWARIGRIPAIRPSSKCLRFDVDEVMRALKQKENQ